MATVTIKEATVGSAAGTDLMSGTFFYLQSFPRTVTRIGVVGSSAVGNAAIDLYFGSEKIGTFYNTSSGVVVPLEAKDLIPIRTNKAMAANEPLHVIVNTVSVTNVFVITLEIQEL